jgi:hypothetical protein
MNFRRASEAHHFIIGEVFLPRAPFFQRDFAVFHVSYMFCILKAGELRYFAYISQVNSAATQLPASPELVLLFDLVPVKAQQAQGNVLPPPLIFLLFDQYPLTR